ncbi:ABC transporter substrate-binding protein [Phytopseudomonas dryadis]|uniref:Type IV secretion system putative lipoprotein virB7 n=1 Tax=Phytopseudomonas dryadis TaxID=2487520 RepID=A0ABY1Z187_9GAMM|nr:MULTISPECIES: ABC transporter substrate-binding protein [Pseudomonas]TBV01252.1 iron ABC transporter substrate-binding protein [Pseudomonas dryadis]TBV14710.1 iron ABC transporter substrate-binding protein [Pseudomonas sp. FRB 230]
MKKITLLTLLALAVAGCSHNAQQPPSTLSITQAGAQVEVPRHPQKVVTFDYGTYDSLLALGVGDRVLAVPGNVPPYLASSATGVQDAGGMKTPNLETVRALQPDLIMVTGRQTESRDELDAIAPTLDMGINDSDYLAGVARNVTLLGQLFDKPAEAEQALAALRGKVEQARQLIASSGKRTLVLTHNEGRFSPTEQAVIYSLLQAPRALPAPPPQPADAPRQRPQPLTPQAAAESNPDVIFIVDRSAAIGGDPLDVATLADSPLASTTAAKTKRIVYLDPPLWYLSGGGLQSLDLQIEQILAAYR